MHPATEIFLSRANATAQDESVPSFIPTRWPHTYAYDFVRAHTTEGSGMSRAYAANYLKQMFPVVSTREAVKCDLARMYCERHGVAVPEGY